MHPVLRTMQLLQLELIPYCLLSGAILWWGQLRSALQHDRQLNT